MKKYVCLVTGIVLCLHVAAQNSPADTVVVQLARSSQLIFTIEDPSDIELLRHYDFQALFDDMLTRLEDGDTTRMDFDFGNMDNENWDIDMEEGDEEEDEMDEDDEEDEDFEEGEDFEDDEDFEEDEDFDGDGEYNGDEDYEDDDHDGRRHRFFNSISMDFGIGNYLEDFKFPDANGAQYAVRPWGSWYVGLNSIYHTHINNSFKLEWGFGVSWYNFKFQDERTVMMSDSFSVYFERDLADLNFIKSKLTLAHLNLSLVPMVEFGQHREHSRWWKSHRRAFRVGAGVYGGYRIGSYTKQVYEIDNEKKKIRNHDNFYLNNLRYGVRFQFGIHDTDFFINYDLNELFVDGRGPKLNAYSFGIIF